MTTTTMETETTTETKEKMDMKAEFQGVTMGHGRMGGEVAPPDPTNGERPPVAPPAPLVPAAPAAAPLVALPSPRPVAVIPDDCPFLPAAKRQPRVKGFFYGATGSGKTTTALQFPRAAVIDLEGGTQPYASRFPFHVLPADATNTVGGLEQAVQWLLTHRHDFATLVIDPITIIWDMWQRHWSDIFLTRKQDTKYFKHEYYDLQPKDWMPIKAHLKAFMRRLMALDMNIICTAREKDLYADGSVMKKIGTTFDGERSFPYLFDLVAHFEVQPDGTHTATIEKDRWGKIHERVIPATYESIALAFGPDTLARSADPLPLATSDQAAEIRRLFDETGMTPDQIHRGLTRYEVERVEDLREEDARKVLAGLAKLPKKAAAAAA